MGKVRGFGLVASLLLAGCAAQTVDEIKRNPSATHVFSRPVNYQEVYRNIVQTARACWTGGGLFYGAQMGVEADLYPDLGKGEMTIRMSYIGPSIYLHATIDRKAPDLTEVTVRTFYATWNSVGLKVEKWADGSKDC